MSAKISARRRAAFLRALAASGNQTLAAERAKVSRSWVRLHRSADPAFDAAVREAVRQAEGKLREQRERPPAQGYHFGEELVLWGSGAGTRTQLIRARPNQWTPRLEERFLQVLGHSCNVTAACRAIGVSQPSAYQRRARWPGFARRWDVVLDEAIDRLECALLQRGADLLCASDAPCVASFRDMTVSEAIYLVDMHKRRRAREVRKGGLWRRPRTLDELRPGIIAKLEIIERQRERERGAAGG
jgi:hypothetical protein